MVDGFEEEHAPLRPFCCQWESPRLRPHTRGWLDQHRRSSRAARKGKGKTGGEEVWGGLGRGRDKSTVAVEGGCWVEAEGRLGWRRRGG